MTIKVETNSRTVADKLSYNGYAPLDVSLVKTPKYGQVITDNKRYVFVGEVPIDDLIGKPPKGVSRKYTLERWDKDLIRVLKKTGRE